MRIQLPAFLFSRYLEEKNFDTVKLALEKSKKVVIATLEIVPDLEKHDIYGLIEKLPRIDITEGTGSGANYQVNKLQAKSLVEACHVSLFDQGDLEELSADSRQGKTNFSLRKNLLMFIACSVYRYLGL